MNKDDSIDDVNRNAQRRREELRLALEDARLNDAEWLRTVFGENMPTAFEHGNDENAHSLPAGPEELSDMRTFQSLGYSKDEVRALKSSVRNVILDRKKPKPRRGIPDEWLDNSQSQSRRATVTATPSERPPPQFENYKVFDERKSISKEKESDSKYDRGEKFAWKGVPPTVSEIENRINGNENRLEDTELLLNDEQDDPITFWPGKEEFKDLLIEESKARIQLTGSWLKPLVKQEAKWRYNLYKAFLSFVGNDIVDGYDIEPIDGKIQTNPKVTFQPEQENNIASSRKDFIDDFSSFDDDEEKEEGEEDAADDNFWYLDAFDDLDGEDLTVNDNPLQDRIKDSAANQRNVMFGRQKGKSSNLVDNYSSPSKYSRAADERTYASAKNALDSDKITVSRIAPVSRRQSSNEVETDDC